MQSRDLGIGLRIRREDRLLSGPAHEVRCDGSLARRQAVRTALEQIRSLRERRVQRGKNAAQQVERAVLDVRAKAGRHPCRQECASGFGIQEHDKPGEIAGLRRKQRIDEIRPYAQPVQSVGAADGLGQPTKLLPTCRAAKPERPTVRLVRRSRSFQSCKRLAAIVSLPHLLDLRPVARVAAPIAHVLALGACLRAGRKGDGRHLRMMTPWVGWGTISDQSRQAFSTSPLWSSNHGDRERESRSLYICAMLAMTRY